MLKKVNQVYKGTSKINFMK